MNQSIEKNRFNTRGWYIVLISALTGCSIATTFPQFSMTVGSLSLQSGISEQVLLTGDTVKSAAIVISMLTSGFLYKKLGAKMTILIGIICSVVPQFVLPHMSGVPLLMLLKVMQGYASVVFPVFLLLIMDAIEESQSGLATAIFNGVFYSGGGIGGTLAGIFITKSGWVSSYYALGIIGMILGVICLLTLKTSGLKSEDGAKSPSNTDMGSILKTPVLWLLIFGFLSTTFVIQAITVDLPLFSGWLGYDELATGKLATAITMGMLISCLISGKISDMAALRSKNKARARLAVMALGCFIILITSCLLIFTDLTSFNYFYIVVFLFSFGASWGLGTFYAVLPEVYSKDQLTLVTGFAGGAGDMGMPLAPLLVGVIFGARGLWHMGWAVCAIMAIVSLLACAILYFRVLSNKL